MAAIIWLLLLIRIQMHLKPYKITEYNQIENYSMVAVGITLYGGILFMKGQGEVYFIEVFAFTLIIIINAFYIMFWIYLMAKTYDRYKIARKIHALLKLILLRENDDIQRETEKFSNNSNEDLAKAPPAAKNNFNRSNFIENESSRKDALKIGENSKAFKSYDLSFCLIYLT